MIRDKHSLILLTGLVYNLNMAFNKFTVEDDQGTAVLKIDACTLQNVEDFTIVATKAEPIPLVTIKFRANVENER